MNPRQKSFRRARASFAVAVVLFTGILGAGPSKADEAGTILSQLHGRLAKEPTAVKKTALPDLFGVYFSRSDVPAQFVTRGLSVIGNSTIGYAHISAPRIGVNLTPEESHRFFLAMLKELPVSQLITYRYGTGQRKVLLFTAYDCPACRAVERELEKRAGELDATVFLIPLSLQYYSRDPAAVQIVRNIWCAQDPASAWRRAILAREYPPNRSCSRDPDDFANLGAAFPVKFPTSVPTAVTFDGRIYQGVMRSFREIFG